MPWPPPTHIVSRPNSLSRLCSPLSSVVVIRAPVEPNGWPNAIAPPCTLSRSRSMPRSWYDGITWAVLFDQRDDPSGLAYDYNAISAPLHNVANAMTTWPTVDLFGQYL